ncbi:serine/threonine-protein kinase [Vitiosangium sp. GDMCC 1.1324]|uniref:serine/threonine protein kinase n=1 Tax=Vitiosangium sp. (strain GDMCC 1.1324) TaxID=2138576 RepID=UPI000D36083B|nr:serine/threonine-protein kinase [Vitiosangium sp. GDMCC 1.1324]PTL78171.1 serine/threonine protein kinase [Vitiosangium sp. GDMCC 1.1324]
MSIENYGKYQLIKRLAMGGMAQIYLARQRGPEGFEKLVVVKRILPHLAENDEFVRMFLDEARIAARLDHPNIVQIFDLGAQDDSFFIAMEYIHGEDLRRVWKRAERSGQLIPVPLVCRVMIEACAGLDHAHKKVDANGKPLNIVHRDISPQNILLTFEGRAKVVDFGIAKAADQATETRSGVLKGKYSYMSPEQASGQKKLDCRSDIFALGVVLYELLTGARLFKRTNDMATLQAVAECDIKPPSQLNPRVPKDLDPIVMKALARAPEDRYAEALGLQLALEDWLIAHQLPSSTAHVAAFMQDLYAARLAEEAKLGDVLVEEAEVFSPSGGFKAVDRSAAETMAAPRHADADAPAPRRDSTDRLERNAPRTPPRPSRSDPRITPVSERREPEPRRTVDIRRAPAPEHAEEAHSASTTERPVSRPRRTPVPAPLEASHSASTTEKSVPRPSRNSPPVPVDAGSLSTEKLQPRPSRSRQPVVAEAVAEPPPTPRKSNRKALVAIGGSILAGLLLGGWWALRSEPAPRATTAEVKPATEPKPPESAPPVPARAEPTRVQVTLTAKPAQATLTVDGKPYEKTPVVVSAMPGQELTVVAEASRYHPLTRKVTVGQGPAQEESLALEPLPEPPKDEQKPEPVRPATATVERPVQTERPAQTETRRGTVRFAVTPWAEVFCGGRSLGTTPLPDVSLVAGVYECKFSNSDLGMTRTQRVEVKPNSHTRVVVKF